jgi:hypothetical protein
VHRAQPLVQFDQILAMLKALEQVTLPAFLSMSQRLENAVPVQQPRDIVETLLKA